MKDSTKYIENTSVMQSHDTLYCFKLSQEIFIKSLSNTIDLWFIPFLSYHLQTLHSILERFNLVNQAIKFICLNLLIDIYTSCNRQIVMLRRLFISCHIYKFIYSILFAVFPIKATCKVFMIYSTLSHVIQFALIVLLLSSSWPFIDLVKL